MTYEQFRAPVAQMLDAQQNFFHAARKTQSREDWLLESKRLENKVRKELYEAPELPLFPEVEA